MEPQMIEKWDRQLYRALWGLTISIGLLLGLFIFQKIVIAFEDSRILYWLKVAAGFGVLMSWAGMYGNLDIAKAESKKLFRTFYNEQRRLYLYKSALWAFISFGASTLIMTGLSQIVDFSRELMGWLILFAGVMTFLISFLSYNSR